LDSESPIKLYWSTANERKGGFGIVNPERMNYEENP